MNVYLSKELLTMESMRYVFGFIRTTGVVNVDQIECQLQNLINALQAEQQAHNALREKLKELEWSNRGMCPCCKEVKYHDKNCWLNAELQAIKDE